jgi:hypothetical protein
VYFENLVLWASRCALLERDAAFAALDYSPAGINPGDCAIDYQEISAMADTWLSRDLLIQTKNPGDANLVVYYPLNENDSNRVFSHPVSPDVCDTKWTGTFWNGGVSPPGVYGTAWSAPGVSGIGGASCVYMSGEQSARIQCGATHGDLALGIGSGKVVPTEVNAITLSIWVKWLGNRYWDPSGYLQTKCQGLLGKRGPWDDMNVIWMLELDTNGTGRSIQFRHFAGGNSYGTTLPDVAAAGNLMNAFIGEWVHANAHARIYLNGDQVGDGPWRFSYGTDANIYLSIGNTMDETGWNGGAASPESYWGYLDEVRIYNRALDQNEIAYLADTTPADGNLWVPIPSAAEVYELEPEGQRAVNFRDLAKVGDQWLDEQMYPR